MSFVDAHGQITVPEECALNITGRRTVHPLDVLCQSQWNSSLSGTPLYPVGLLKKKNQRQKLEEKKPKTKPQSNVVIVSGGPHYTIVQTVFRLGSKRTALPSTDFALVLYMGFSKAACPLLFSCTEQPVYWVLGVVLWKDNKRCRRELMANMTTL